MEAPGKQRTAPTATRSSSRKFSFSFSARTSSPSIVRNLVKAASKTKILPSSSSKSPTSPTTTASTAPTSPPALPKSASDLQAFEPETGMQVLQSLYDNIPGGGNNNDSPSTNGNENNNNNNAQGGAGPSWKPVSHAELNAQSRLKAAMGKDEVRITHSPLSRREADPFSHAFLMLTNKSLYFVASHLDGVSKWDIQNLFRATTNGENKLVLLWFQGFKLLDPVAFEFQNPLHAELWACILSSRALEIVQQQCETSFVQAPSVYQLCSPVFKLNKRGVEQERVLVLSTTHLHNLECKAWPLVVKEHKWAFKLTDVKGIGCSELSKEIMIQVNPHAFIKGKDRYQFRFLDLESCKEFIHELKRLFRFASGNELPQFEMVHAVF